MEEISSNLQVTGSTRDNIVSSAVDIASILFAYQLGISQLGITAGIAYGVFDAWIVIWQRERIVLFVNRFYCFIRRTGPLRKKVLLPWAPE